MFYEGSVMKPRIMNSEKTKMSAAHPQKQQQQQRQHLTPRQLFHFHELMNLMTNQATCQQNRKLLRDRERVVTNSI